MITPSPETFSIASATKLPTSSSPAEIAATFENAAPLVFENTPYIDYDDSEISVESKEHISETNPSFITESTLFSLKFNDEQIGCIYEFIEGNHVNFGIYTMNNIRGKGLHIVKKYMDLYNKDYILHTTKKCNIADFYINHYHFNPYNIFDDSDLQYIFKK